jgi:hypothetical protein
MMHGQKTINLTLPFVKRFRKIAKSDSELRHVRLSAWNNSAPTGRICMKFDIDIFQKSVEKIRGSLKSNKITGTLHEDQHTFLIISRSCSKKCFSQKL